jgi:hypothetical protein
MPVPAVPLALPQDVEDVWRPLSDTEVSRVQRLIEKASALLRQRLPWVDDRIHRHAVDPTDPGGLDPLSVATVVATVVKRFLSNVQGVASETAGPYAVAYVLRGDKDARGELQITELDIERLLTPSKSRTRIGTIKSHPRLAPWPYGDLGSPAPAGAGSADLLLTDTLGGYGELPYYPSHDSSS